MAKRKSPTRRRRREALVHQHLENVSRDLLEQYPDEVRRFIGRNAGIYALYRKDKLYYVGLATALRGRLRAHVRNRHGNSWDRFSIYLTIKDQHLREIEALLLRIANPKGAKQRGKLAQSRDMRRRITRAIREKQYAEVSSLFGRATTPVGGSRNEAKGDSDLRRLLPQGGKLRGTLKGKIYRARARRSGDVRYNGKIYRVALAGCGCCNQASNEWVVVLAS